MKNTSPSSLSTWALVCVVLASACTRTSDVNNDMPDQGHFKLIRNVSILDGTGAPAFNGSVRIKDNKIIAVGDVEPASGDFVIDGGGQVLAPGFIDTHSHHDEDLDISTDVAAAISQGISTIVVGNDGSSQHTMAELEQMLKDKPASVNVSQLHRSRHDTFQGDGRGLQA